MTNCSRIEMRFKIFESSEFMYSCRSLGFEEVFPDQINLAEIKLFQAIHECLMFSPCGNPELKHIPKKSDLGTNRH